jgi:hypothetical protein
MQLTEKVQFCPPFLMSTAPGSQEVAHTGDPAPNEKQKLEAPQSSKGASFVAQFGAILFYCAVGPALIFLNKYLLRYRSTLPK